MALYKSAQVLPDTLNVSDKSSSDETPSDEAGKDEVIIYEEKPSQDDVIEMHKPTDEFEITFKLQQLPGAEDDSPIEVSMDDNVEVTDKLPKNKKEKLEVDDPWDWKTCDKFLNWLLEKLQNIPRHSGHDTAGIERTVSYLKKVDNEISKAMQSDYNAAIDSNKVEEARGEIDNGISRLEERLEQLMQNKFKSKSKKKKSDAEHEIVKEGKQTHVGGVIVTVPIFISSLARACINGMVSAGKDIEDIFEKQVKEYSLDKREQVELTQLLIDMGYAMPRRDRGQPVGKVIDYTSTDNVDFGANYSS